MARVASIATPKPNPRWAGPHRPGGLRWPPVDSGGLRGGSYGVPVYRTRTVRRSRMSADDAPTMTSYSPGATTKPDVFSSQ